MAGVHRDIVRTASPGAKHVAFDSKCQVIPEGDCAELRNLLSLCPTRAQSPPIATSTERPSSFIARAISPQLTRAKSPLARAISPQQSKKSNGLGHAAPQSSTSWRNRFTSWGSIDTNTSSISSAFGTASHSSSSSAISPASTSIASSGPRLVAPVASRGVAAPLSFGNDDDEEDDFVQVSRRSAHPVDDDDVDAEFQQAISGVTMNQHHARIDSLGSQSMFQAPRPSSPFVRSASAMPYPRQASHTMLKSCLVRSRTPQAPYPPRFDGSAPLRTVRSHDRDTCTARRRRADGVPVICASPLSSPEDERAPDGWGLPATTSQESGKHQKLDKSVKSRWRRFRRTASEESQTVQPTQPSGSGKDEYTIRREIASGKWPFEARLNEECSCKNCQERIEVGLASDYEPKWTRAARIRWLEGQEDAAQQAKTGSIPTAGAASSQLPRSMSRTAIQADEVAQLHNETAHPMTTAELAEEPSTPTVEQGEPSELAKAAVASAVNAQATKPPNPNGLEEGDDTLRREIIARRQRMARQSPVMRHGARSMMRQLEEAERRESEAAKSRSRSQEGHRDCGCGRSSPALANMSPSLPSTPDSVSTTPQEHCATSKGANSNPYFDMPVPERARSPLIPTNAAPKPCFARSLTNESSSGLSMSTVALSLEAAVAQMSSPPSLNESPSSGRNAEYVASVPESKA